MAIVCAVAAAALPERIDDLSAFAVPAAPPAAPAPLAWDEAVARATIFSAPPRRYDFILGDGAFKPDEELTCVLQPTPAKGTTRKLYCALRGGDVVKVKYGAQNEEVPAEIAASRLMSAIGLGADRMYLVKKLRCFGCGPDPFLYHECLRKLEHREAWETKPDSCPAPDYSRYTDFSNVAIERKLAGTKIPAPQGTGIRWLELDKLTGASAAERDALRMVMTLLQHWDDEPENQRIVCTEPSSCRFVLHDVGASFGSWRAAFDVPRGEIPKSARMSLDTWRAEPVFADRAKCLVHRPRGKKAEMQDPKPPQVIEAHEAGRRLLADRLGKLSDRQLEELFRGAGVAASKEWAAVLRAKIREIQSARCKS